MEVNSKLLFQLLDSQETEGWQGPKIDLDMIAKRRIISHPRN
jgi:hypothetical protein